MQNILHNIWAWVFTWALSIATLWKIFTKYSPRIKKSIEITDEVLDILRAIMNAMEDRKITKQEIELIAKEIEDLQEILTK